MFYVEDMNDLDQSNDDLSDSDVEVNLAAAGPLGPQPQKKRKLSSQSKNISNISKLLPLLEKGDFAAFEQKAAVSHILHERDSKGNSYLHKLVYMCIKKGFANKEASFNFVLQQAPQLIQAVNDKGQTPLAIACYAAKEPHLIRYILDACPEAIKIVDKDKNTALHLFASRVQERNISFQNCIRIINKLIKVDNAMGGDLLQSENKKGQNVVCSVLARSDIHFLYVFGIAKLLFQRHPHLVSDSGVHAIKFLLQKISLEILEFLVKLCPEEFYKTDASGYNAVTYLIEQSSPKHILQKLKLIYNNVPGITVTEQDLKVALIKKCDFGIIEYLLKKSPADININNVVNSEDGMTLLMQYGTSMEAINILLAKNADPNVCDKKGHSALCVASKVKNPQLIMRLLEGGANPLLIIDNNGNKLACLDLHSYLLSNDDLLQYTSNLDTMKTEDQTESMIEFYMHFIRLLYEYYAREQVEDTVVKKLQIMVNSNPLVVKMLYALESNSFCDGFRFQVDVIGFLLHLHQFREDVINEPEKPVGFLKILLRVGFKFSNTSQLCLTSLTALLLTFKDQATFDQLQPMIAALILDASVNIGSMALTNYTSFLEDIRYGSIGSIEVETKEARELPDALFLAFHHYDIELVKYLLPHWWGAPLGLLSFALPYLDGDFQRNYIADGLEVQFLPLEEVGKRVHRFLTQLLVYGGIPHGTPLFRDFDRKMRPLMDDIRNHLPETVWNTCQEITCTPLKLQQLCKYKIRELLAKRASKGDTDLPKLLEQTVEPTLLFLVK